MEKTRNSIQSVVKAGKIICKIFFVICVIGVILLMVSVISLSSRDVKNFRLDDEMKTAFSQAAGVDITGDTLAEAMPEAVGINMNTLAALAAVSMVTLAAEAVVLKSIDTCLLHELEIGTPFSLTVAREMKKVGLTGIIAPLAASIIGAVILAVMKEIAEGVPELSFGGGSIALGVAFLVLSLICRYGAETAGEREEDAGCDGNE